MGPRHNIEVSGIMRGLNLKPSRVYQTASQLLETGSISQAPPWFKTIGSIPPSEILTRTQPVQHREVTRKSKTRKPSKMFRPQPIVYEEDKLQQPGRQLNGESVIQRQLWLINNQ